MTDREHKAAAELELLCGLRGGSSHWSLREWRAVLARLPAKERRVVVLRMILGMKWAAVGERMGYSTGRGPQLLGRALRRLKPYLTDAA